VSDATRRQALGALGVPLLLAATAPRAFAAAAKGTDAGVKPSDDPKKRAHDALSAALELEQTAVVAYEAIANSGRLSGRATTLLRNVLADDREHADQLATALDDADVKPPIPPRRATIPGLSAVRDDQGAARFAIALEERTIAAHLVYVRDANDSNVLRIVAGAMGTDGQHLVVLRELAGVAPVPRAFERGR
jgi:rubrerythrin